MKLPDAWVMKPKITPDGIKIETEELMLCKSCVYHEDNYCKLHGMNMANNDYCSDARGIK